MGAIALCVIVSVFIVLPSTWGGPTVDPSGITLSTSAGDPLTAPHALAPTQLRVASVVQVSVLAVALLAAVIVLAPGERRQHHGDSRHGSRFIRSVMRRRGPPAHTHCFI